MTYWLSFVDDVTGQFLGVAVVDVTAAEAQAMVPELDVSHPRRQPGSEGIAAAVRRAWETGCNPGGAVGVVALEPTTDAQRAKLASIPRNTLLDRATLKRLDLLAAQDEGDDEVLQ